ncbi:hypothetical protein WMY93_027696 [Mugilogobius chulae]|uniref:Uncharacterized protein n=1 Tax=Mugilogobius chulae TaxID=88201 RepID=A0AAW0MTN9_9GOBI
MAAASTTIEPEGGKEAERSTKRNREDYRAKSRPIVPDLDLDTVDQESRHKSQKHRKRSGKNQQEEGRSGRSLSRNRAPSWGEKGVDRSQEEESRRTQSVSRNRAPSWDRNTTEEGVWKNPEEGRSSRSLPRNRATSRSTFRTEDGVVLETTEKKRRSKCKEEDLLRNSVKTEENRGSKRISEPFSFLMPRDDQPLSDNESVASFSEMAAAALSDPSCGPKMVAADEKCLKFYTAKSEHQD